MVIPELTQPNPQREVDKRRADPVTLEIFNQHFPFDC